MMPIQPGAEPEIRYFFIRRPVLAAVISIVITLLGLFAIQLLPIARYPQITPPAVRISANYPGASSEDAAQAVAAPIEQQLAGLQGMLYYSSSNSSDGTTNITVTFDVSRNQDLAAVDVQNAVKLAEPQLPEAVRTNGITILKANTDILCVVALQSSDARYDATYLANYMKLYVVDELKRVQGVGDATPFPLRDFSMLLQLDPEKMAQLKLTVSDVAAAVREQNATNPAGRLGAEPSPPGTQLTLPITTLGRLETTGQFDSIVVRARPDGSLIRLSDIGSASLGARSYDLKGRLNGTPTAFVLVYTRPGANALAVKQAVVRRMDELQKTFPQGIRYLVPFDTTPFVSASIKEVAITLVEAMILVTLVVFLFLQSWRATLIPMLAVPVSVVGTFLGLLAFGMSINVLTLFGLVLAIGIVVDDAIVVIENVERIMATEKLSPKHAADRAIRQVGSALVAIVLVLCSVFVPVAFIGGVTGEFFKQFAVTIIIAVVLSGVVALTLTPALCALLLKDSNETHTTGFFGWFNRMFASATRGYGGAVDSVLQRPAAWFGVFFVLIALAGLLWTRIPTAFIPTEDKGYMALSVQLPDAASLQRTEATVSQHREDASRRAGSGEHGGARRTRPAQRVERHEWRDGVSESQTVGRTAKARRARFDRRSHQPQAVRHERRGGVRLQLAGGPRSWDYRGRRDQSSESQRAGHSTVRAARAGVQAGRQSASRRRGTQLVVPRERAAGVRDRRPRGGEGPRREPHRFVCYPSVVPVVALRQRFQFVRKDVSRSGEGRRAISPVAE